ncbi:uncharacterized protein LAJ45_10075 [Morchella importuna]|uniref:uncharacterized protein n=1 Tax=Morchella importuna TaxID=1174673 RepID=UPI001E8DB00D|nr:uncharacterized protein LAJ45_10075 [Morchella importuna]KAH8145933.1 hypothetical protein LAJ45_10075 [Morchella importuna]
MNISYLARNRSRGSLFYRLSLSRPYSEQNEPHWPTIRRISPSSNQPQGFHEAEEVDAEWNDGSAFDPTDLLKKRGLRSQVWDDPKTGTEAPGGPNPSLWAQPVWRPVKLAKPVPSEGKEGDESTPIYLRESTRPVVPEENGNKLLHRAVDPWNEEEVKKVLEKGNADINCRNYSGMTPLHRAAQQNFAQGKIVYSSASRCRKNSDVIVRLLLDARARVNPPEGTKTPPVHLAARLKRKAILSLLMKANPNLYLRDALGRTPLHHAAEKDEYKGVFMLLTRRDGIIDIQDDEGNTALHLALKNDCQTTTAMLVQMGADYNIPSPQGGVMDEMLVEVALDKLVRFRGIPGMKNKYYGPFPTPRPVKRLKTAVMGVGDDWADRMAEEKEAARLRKKELRELRLEKHKGIKDKWKSPFVFKQEDRPGE